MTFFRSAIRSTAVIYSVILLCLNSSHVRADVTIDSFQDSQGPMVAGYGTGAGAFVTSYPHVLGGRGLILEATTVSLFGGETVSVDINPDDFPDVLEYESLDAIAGGELTLMYGNEYANNPSVSSLNLNVDSSADVLRINFAIYNHFDDQDMVINTTVGTDAGYSVLIPEIVSSPGSQSLDIPLTSFSESTIDYVTFDFTAPPGTDFDLGSIEFANSVPEPALAGAILLLLVRRQKLNI